MTLPKQRRKRGLRMWYILLAICLIGLVGVFAAIAVFRFRAHDQLEQRIEALRAQGYPMSAAEMNGWYRDNYPDYVDNAWPVYLSAFDACVHGGSKGMWCTAWARTLLTMGGKSVEPEGTPKRPGMRRLLWEQKRPDCDVCRCQVLICKVTV